MSNLNLTNDNDVITELNLGATSSAPDDSALNSAATCLGYCHVCNKQNRINIESFTCIQCNGGFIELFDLDEPRRPQQNETLIDDSSQRNEMRDNIANGFIFINNNSQSNRSESSHLNTPLFQLIRRINNRSSRIPSSSSSSTTTPTDSLSDTLNQETTEVNNNTINLTNSRENNSRNNSSFHYRLRRHTNPHSSTINPNSSGSSNSGFSSNVNSTVFSPSISSRHHHRHRFVIIILLLFKVLNLFNFF